MTIDENLTTPDEAFVSEWATRFLDAWNALDGAAVANLCAEDIVWRDPSTPEPLVGQNAVRTFVETTGAAFPDLRIRETARPCILRGTKRVLAPYLMTGTMRGPIDGFAPTDRPISVRGVDDWWFRGELLSGYCTYYDTLEAARQLGIMPAPGSSADRIMVRLQHLQAAVQRRRLAAG